MYVTIICPACFG